MTAIEWSIVIPAARPDRVVQTVSSLLKQTLEKSRYEIIIATPDSSRLPCSMPDGVKVVTTAHLFPPGRMRNCGAREARGEYICFIDDDCYAPSSLLERFAAIFKRCDRVGAVGCRVVTRDTTFWNQCADQALFTAYQTKKSGIVSGLGSAAMAVRQELFLKTGGFDEELMASEDYDFSMKLRKQGWLCWFDPGVEVLHDHRRGSLKAIIRCAWKYGAASGLTVQKRHREAVSGIAKMMLLSARYNLYWLLMIPYACFLTLVWLVETRPTKMLLCLPVIISARLAYQFGVFRTLMR